MRFPFALHQPMTCRAPFRFAGKAYHPGDPVPNDLAPPRRMEQLYNSRLIDCVAPGAPIVVRTAAAPQPVATVAAPATQAVPDAGALRMEHRQFGRYYIVSGETTLSGPHTKAEAQAIIADPSRWGAGAPAVAEVSQPQAAAGAV